MYKRQTPDGDNACQLHFALSVQAKSVPMIGDKLTRGIEEAAVRSYGLTPGRAEMWVASHDPSAKRKARISRRFSRLQSAYGTFRANKVSGELRGKRQWAKLRTRASQRGGVAALGRAVREITKRDLLAAAASGDASTPAPPPPRGWRPWRPWGIGLGRSGSRNNQKGSRKGAPQQNQNSSISLQA